MLRHATSYSFNSHYQTCPHRWARFELLQEARSHLGRWNVNQTFANRYFRTRHLYSRQSSLSVLPCSSSAGAEIPNEHARRKNPSPRTVCEHAEPSAPLLARHKMVEGVDTLTVVSVGRSSAVGNPSLFAVHRRRQSPVVAHRSPSIVRLRW